MPDAPQQPVVLRESLNSYTTALTLNRPERRNALSMQLMLELVAAVEAASNDSSQRVLVLRGAGNVFCAGLDLKEASEAGKSDASAYTVAKVMQTVHGCPLVTIAAIHGAAMAGGAGLMSACDFVVAAEQTKIGYPETKRGLVAALVMTFLLRQLRERDVRELLLLAEPIDARRALKIGLVNCVVPRERVSDEVTRIASLVVQGGPQAVAHTKQLIAELRPPTVAQDIERAVQFHLRARTSDEAAEGIAAFLEKRPPNWVPKASSG
jgi:methylglutaconyl-CoA hydratase